MQKSFNFPSFRANYQPQPLEFLLVGGGAGELLLLRPLPRLLLNMLVLVWLGVLDLGSGPGDKGCDEMGGSPPLGILDVADGPRPTNPLTEGIAACWARCRPISRRGIPSLLSKFIGKLIKNKMELLGNREMEILSKNSKNIIHKINSINYF